MVKLKLYTEDEALAEFVRGFTQRMLESTQFLPNWTSGGKGRALRELKDFVSKAMSERFLWEWDILVVGVDADRKGLDSQRQEIKDILGSPQGIAPLGYALAVPDPHVEAWFFLDPEALCEVLGCDQELVNEALKEARGKRPNFKVLFGKLLRKVGAIETASSAYARKIALKFNLELLNREPRRVLRRAWRSLKLFKRDLEELVRLT